MALRGPKGKRPTDVDVTYPVMRPRAGAAAAAADVGTRLEYDQMLGELLKTELEVAKLRGQFLRERLSTLSRDQFRRGYVTGYEAGRLEERSGAPDAMTPYRSEPHPQVEVDGIEVDEGMRDLLVALWKLGLDTHYSCQGHADKFFPRGGYGRDYATQIVFGNVDHAVKFTKKTAELLGFDNYREGGVVLTTMAPTDGATPRAEVTFSPVLLPEVTDAWCVFEKTVPQVEVTEKDHD